MQQSEISPRLKEQAEKFPVRFRELDASFLLYVSLQPYWTPKVQRKMKDYLRELPEDTSNWLLDPQQGKPPINSIARKVQITGLLKRCTPHQVVVSVARAAVDASRSIEEPIETFVGRTRRGESSRARLALDRERTATIREWARSSGRNVAKRGRISAEIIEAYYKEQGTLDLPNHQELSMISS
ncbi:Lsr2 family DNA-binding protein [Nocardia puris]|uniref:Lsr2 family DNA-binding protein n=1 Tax=Nocardia puris TaxID=208602 RepID=UPI001E304EC4|nr:histone-like nucleoid-structuring protein Lsr2 [Nocardia puris]